MTTQPVAIITAASKGMGAACTRELARRGYQLVLLSRSEAVQSIAAETNAVYIQGSVTNPADLQALVDLAMAHYGRIDAVVNNTGHPPKGDLLAIRDDDWHLGLDMLLLNVVRLARLVTPIMAQQGKGAIVNISAFGAEEPSLSFPVSSALRAGLAAFTKLFADRYASQNIRMNNILPGFIDTFDVSGELRAQIPMGRAGSVEEIARTAAFLLSDDAGYITGQNIRVDGGITKSL